MDKQSWVEWLFQEFIYQQEYGSPPHSNVNEAQKYAKWKKLDTK